MRRFVRRFMRRFVRRPVREVWMRENTRRIQSDEAIATGEVQAPPAPSDPSTWDVEAVTVHQDVADINDGREMGVMSSNSSNNVSPAASSGAQSPVSHGPGQPCPSSGVAEDDASDASIWNATSEVSSPRSSPCSLFSSSPSSSLSSSPSSEDYILHKVNATNLSNCDISTEVAEEVLKGVLENVKGSSIILAFDYSRTCKVAQDLNLHNVENAVTIIDKHTQLFGGPVQCLGFGDSTTRGKNIFPFKHDQGCCNGIEEFYENFRNIAQCVQKGQSTSLVPIIHTAMDIVSSSGGQHHILIIFTEHSDQVDVEAVVDASFYALSIVVVGVGDGPWLEMQHSIANLPLPCDCCICKRHVIKYPVVYRCNHTTCMRCVEGVGKNNSPGVHPCPLCREPLQNHTLESSRRRFLNAHFANYNEIMQMDLPKETKEALFVLECFKHTPTQRKHIQHLGILGSTTGKEQHSKPLGPPLGCNPDLVPWDDCHQDLPGSSTLWPILDP